MSATGTRLVLSSIVVSRLHPLVSNHHAVYPCAHFNISTHLSVRRGTRSGRGATLFWWAGGLLRGVASRFPCYCASTQIGSLGEK